jgi:hypothetical protein
VLPPRFPEANPDVTPRCRSRPQNFPGAGVCPTAWRLGPLRRGFFHVRSSSSRTVRVTVFWQPLHLKILVWTGAFAGTRGSTLIGRSGAAQCGHMGAIKVGDISDNVVRSDSPITALSGLRRGFFVSSRWTPAGLSSVESHRRGSSYRHGDLHRSGLFLAAERLDWAAVNLGRQAPCLTRFGARLPRSGGAFLVLRQERWPVFPGCRQGSSVCEATSWWCLSAFRVLLQPSRSGSALRSLLRTPSSTIRPAFPINGE